MIRIIYIDEMASLKVADKISWNLRELRELKPQVDWEVQNNYTKKRVETSDLFEKLGVRCKACRNL